jgi:uncharacterized OB-fold protein
MWLRVTDDMTHETAGEVIRESWTVRYDYTVGEVASRFMAGIRAKKLLATRCAESAITYLPPRAYCERTFAPCEEWVEAASEGVVEASTVVVRGFANGPQAPYAIAFVRLGGIDTAVANYVHGLDLSDPRAAAARLTPGTRMRVEFDDAPTGRITDFHFVLAP